MALPKIELPIFTITLPSTGELVEYRPFTTDEEKILLIAEEGKDPTEMLLATKNLIKNCVKSIDIEKLTSFDTDFLFLQLVSKSVSNVSELYFKAYACGKTGGECEKNIKLTIDLSEIAVQQYDEESQSYVKYEPIEYKSGGVLIQITKSIGVIMKHLGFAEQEIYSKIKNPTEDDLVKLAIVGIYDDETVTTKDEYTAEELDEFYGTIPPIQLKELKTFLRNTPRVRYETVFKCKECGFEEPVLFEDIESFFGLD
jgi:hypothetical protein